MNEIAVVTEQDIPDILRMIHEIYSELPNKEWFSLDSDEEVTSYMMTGGFGLKAMCDGRLAGVFIARAKNLGDENLGYDLKFDEEQRKQSAHMEIAMVRSSYRGNGLQKKLMERVIKLINIHMREQILCRLHMMTIRKLHGRDMGKMFHQRNLKIWRYTREKYVIRNRFFHIF